MVQAGHLRYTGEPVRGKAVGGPTDPRRNDRQTTHDRQGLETNVLSVNKFRLTQQPRADRHLETYMVFAKPEIHGDLSNSVNEHVVNRVKVETSRIIKKITLEKINHKTKYIKI